MLFSATTALGYPEDPETAAQLARALTAYQSGDYETAIGLWRALANWGDPIASYYLGRLYEEGRGVPQDYQLALRMYARAARHGLPEAETQLGMIYLLKCDF